ncbi:hypothetical protein HZQ11_12525 [Elizabethkingia anophelis]|nr:MULTISPECIES: hypothetical protein [Elizabethkingia]KUF46446.1 hypothetical protein AS358_14700 [Elizabethkingia anophelis]MCT3645135.1 hypothetical protein [Elizabethkingia anophelis]MCT3652942.1 hypothetical protein [Elizabethkingia anophelis]MCT3656188.1 hypothetical protein [Elizabethkingia anophelis]MCT3660236.1 hypothetical protein [Elizabethkingia anophelis]
MRLSIYNTTAKEMGFPCVRLLQADLNNIKYGNFVTESNSMKPIGGVIAVRQNLFQSSAPYNRIINDSLQ